MELTLASVNAFNLYGSTDPRQVSRFERLERLVAGLDADVLAVQEIISRPTSTAGEVEAVLAENVRRLAARVGRRCELPDGQVVCAVGGGIHHTALLWRDGLVEPLPETVGCFGRLAGMWHSLVTCVFKARGARFRVGSVQLSPFDPGAGWGWRDAGQVLRAMNTPDGRPGFVGGDWNGMGATTVDLPDGGKALYDHDPYHLVEPWHPDFAYQYGPDGELDRSAAYRLEQLGRLRDAARITGMPWTPTTGHHPNDHHPPRRIDRWYATHTVPDEAVTAVEVVPADVVGEATDHAPVLLRIDTDALRGGTA